MNKKIYFDIHIDFLRDGYRKMTIADLTKAFNAHFGMDASKLAVQKLIYKNKIKCGRVGSQKLFKDNRLLTDAQAAFVKKAYKEMPGKAVTAALNENFGTSFTEQQIDTHICNHKVSSGRTGQFPPKNKPWNAGTKGLMTANSGAFKKGNLPARTRPLYAERLNREKLVEIKVPYLNRQRKQKTQFMPKQRWIYEQHFGPIPDGHIVSFKDGDQYNFDPDNLMLLSRLEMLTLNRHRYRKMPDELKPTLVALSKLESRMYAKKKEKKDE